MPSKNRNIYAVMSEGDVGKTICSRTGLVSHKIEHVALLPDGSGSVLTHCGKILPVRTAKNPVAMWGLWNSRTQGEYSNVTCSHCPAKEEAARKHRQAIQEYFELMQERVPPPRSPEGERVLEMLEGLRMEFCVQRPHIEYELMLQMGQVDAIERAIEATKKILSI